MVLRAFLFSMRLLLVVLLFSMSFISYGQKYSMGARVAPCLIWPSFGDKDEKQTFSRGLIPGFSGSLLVSFPLKKNFDLFLEGGYSRKGRKLKFNNDEWTNRSTYNFIDLNMLLRRSYKFKLDKDVPSFFFFNLGPEVSYWLSGKGKTIVTDIGYDYTIVFNKPPDGDFKKMYMNDVNRWLFGIGLGVGLKAPVSKNQYITTELRFSSGHTFLGKKDSSHIEILTYQDTMLTNLKAISLSVSYSLDFDVQQSRKGKSTLKKSIRKTR